MTKTNTTIYLDYAASTPVHPEVFAAMEPYFSKQYGNPGALHGYGQDAIKGIDFARETVANALGADFREIIFTGSATEANNLALRGTMKRVLRDKDFEGTPKIILSEIEHDSVIETAKDLEKRGAEIEWIPVDQHGIVDPKRVERSIDENTILVSIMYANNEIGTIQPIRKIAEIVHNTKGDMYPLFHTDAVQAFQFLNCDVDDLEVDMMTISGHKIYGPKGVGVLYVNRDNFAPNKNPLDPFVTGGGQEFGLRSGTENTPNIVGFGKAVEYIEESKDAERERIQKLKDIFRERIEGIATIEINGKGNMLPNILNVYIPNTSSEDLLIKLDMNGVAVSSGAACSARSTKQSHVLKALGLSSKRINGSLRLSLGRPTTEEEIKRAADILDDVIND